MLRVIVESLMYPVSLEILHQIFQRFGKVLKIVTFTKNNSFQVSDWQRCKVDPGILTVFFPFLTGPDSIPRQADGTACA